MLNHALADDALEGLPAVLHGDVPAKDLLRLRVKPTYNNPEDENGFFHSTASFGLCFCLGENAAQLATRNNCEDVATALWAAADGEGRARYERRLTAAPPERHQLARAVVKDVYHNAQDQDTIYHFVAGLRFEIGDTLYDLAKRNSCKQAEQALERYRARSLRCHQLQPSDPKELLRPGADMPTDLTVAHLGLKLEKAGTTTFVSSQPVIASGCARAQAENDQKTRKVEKSKRRTVPKSRKVTRKTKSDQKNEKSKSPKKSKSPEKSKSDQKNDK